MKYFIGFNALSLHLLYYLKIAKHLWLVVGVVVVVDVLKEAMVQGKVVVMVVDMGDRIFYQDNCWCTYCGKSSHNVDTCWANHGKHK